MCRRTSVSLEDEYNEAVQEITGDITRLTRSLKTIFSEDRADTAYRTSGRLDINRLTNGKLTARVFEKNIEPAFKSDVAVCVAIDESGSMSGSKALAARMCAIGLAEVFDKLKIPLYVMGFTADDDGVDSIHYHYICWNNSKQNRMKLLNIRGRCCNFDGYSIRVASQILEKKQAMHKMLIVISDGQPSSDKYRSDEQGIFDTKLAVKESSRKATTIGVLLGSVDPEVHKQMYGSNFLHITNVKEMFQKISGTISKQIKNW